MRTGNLEWQDTTSYSQSTPKQLRVATQWSLRRLRYTLTVFCKQATSWFMCCREQNMWDVPVGYSGVDPEKACTAGLKLFSDLVRRRAAEQLKVARDARLMVQEAGGTSGSRTEYEAEDLPLSV